MRAFINDGTAKDVARKQPARLAQTYALQRRCACQQQSGGSDCSACQQQIRHQAATVDEAQQKSSAPEMVSEVLRTNGEPLDSKTRVEMEARFGHDFSRVRVHSDARAAQSAQAVSASAYTVGQNIVFGAGQYRPTADAGQRLIAHELAHTIQQRSISANHAPSMISEPGDASEREAERAVEAALGEESPAIQQQPGPVLARQSGGSGEQRPVAGPSPTVPGEPPKDEFLDTLSKPQGRDKKNPYLSTWGWGAPETNNLYQECTVIPLPRARFLSFEASLPKRVQRRTGSDRDGPRMPLAATWPDMQSAAAPVIAAEPVQEGDKTLYRIKPTHAEMPQIKSAHTQAGIFEEHDTPFSSVPECPNLRGRAPLLWQITPDGADKLRNGELEHCSDIRAAFDATLALYASIINNEAAAERRYNTAESAVAETKKRLRGLPADDVAMVNACGQEILKTVKRDTTGWHLGMPRNMRKPQQNGCRGYLGVFNAESFPEVGDGPGKEKHPPSEVM